VNLKFCTFVQDRTQPDVYETSDLPEDDQYLDGQAPVWVSDLFCKVLLKDKKVDLVSHVSILTRDIDIANLSVCLLSVTFRYQMKTVYHIVIVFFTIR